MTNQTYHLFSIIVGSNHVVTARQVGLAGYDFEQALNCVEHLERTRRTDKKFGSFWNPLRYEARSTVGIAQRGF